MSGRSTGTTTDEDQLAGELEAAGDRAYCTPRTEYDVAVAAERDAAERDVSEPDTGQ